MIRRLFLYLVTLLVLFAVAYSAGQWDKPEILLREHASRLSSWLSRQRDEARKWADTQTGPLNTESLEKQAKAPYTVIRQSGDSLVFYSNHRIIPGKQTLRRFAEAGPSGVYALPGGYYYGAHDQRGSGILQTVLIPIRYNLYSGEIGRFPAFPADENISDRIVFDQDTGVPVVVDGKSIGALHQEGGASVTWLQWVQLLFYALFFLLLTALVDRGARFLGARIRGTAGFLTVLVFSAGLLFLNKIFQFTARTFESLSLFNPTFTDASGWISSLGDWLVAVMLAVWCAVYFYRHVGNRVYSIPPGAVFGVAMMCYVGAMCGIVATAAAVSYLSRYGGLSLDFDHFLSLGTKGLLALLSVVGLTTAFFVFSHRLMRFAQSCGLDRTKRLTALGIGLTGAAVFGFILGVENLPALLAFTLVYGFLLEVFTHTSEKGFGWVVVWLLLFSSFATFLLYGYHAKAEKAARREYALALSTVRDTAVAEPLLQRLYDQLEEEIPQLNNYLKPWPFKGELPPVYAHVARLMLQDKYLFEHYRLRICAFDQERQPVLLDQRMSYEEVVQQFWEKGASPAGRPSLRYVTDDKGVFWYLLRLPCFRMGDQNQPADMYVMLEHSYPAMTRTFTRLFQETPYKNMRQLGRFDYAVSDKGRLQVEQGLAAGVLDITGLKAGETRDITFGDYQFAVSKSADGDTSGSIGRASGGVFRPLYLFSLIFMLTALFLFALAVLNSVFQFLPEEYGFKLGAKGSLAKRIHLWNVSLIAVSFLIIGLLTYRHFTRTARETELKNINYRADVLHNSLRLPLLNADSGKVDAVKALQQTADNLSTDAQLYDREGNLVFSTREDLVRQSVLSDKMNPLALAEIRQSGAPAVYEEYVGGLPCSVKYMPVRDKENRIQAYLASPFLKTSGTAGLEASDFIGALAGLYVFLLLIAYVTMFLLADSIIKPVRLLSENVRSLRLEDKNEPLQYEGDAQDEISELIGQYNRMVDQLEDSKVKLVRLEREGAWREMARQVAHDIKNPLTTMKLSMQQLERVSGNPEQAAAFLRKAITRLIEQIDSLAQIASEFSMFANLDIRNKSDVLLNEVVESVHDLFSEQRQVDFNLSLPQEKLHIQGDKNHLIRVFNNLVINAIQAIPSDRRGQVRVSLEHQGKLARVRISDNGGGIPPEIRDRVFEPNFTTKTSGSGLGLAICKKIIEAHDGSIRFETRDNEGTDFYVDLPVTGFTKD